MYIIRNIKRSAEKWKTGNKENSVYYTVGILYGKLENRILYIFVYYTYGKYEMYIIQIMEKITAGKMQIKE